MEIYVVRHTRPLGMEGTCYGHADIPVDETVFHQSANEILLSLPAAACAIYSSPLQRCSRLAAFVVQHKYANQNIQYHPLLMELNFGDWENKKWNDIEPASLQLWMDDYVNVIVPGGENFIALHQRTAYFIEELKSSNYQAVVVITHAGFIRSLSTHLLQTKLTDAFSIACDYGSVSRWLV